MVYRRSMQGIYKLLLTKESFETKCELRYLKRRYPFAHLTSVARHRNEGVGYRHRDGHWQTKVVRARMPILIQRYEGNGSFPKSRTHPRIRSVLIAYQCGYYRSGGHVPMACPGAWSHKFESNIDRSFKLDIHSGVIQYTNRCVCVLGYTGRFPESRPTLVFGVIWLCTNVGVTAQMAMYRRAYLWVRCMVVWVWEK